VPSGQTEAALALGLRLRQVFVKIVLPQALKVIFPALTSQIIIMMLESAVVSQIAVRELTYEADMLQARTFRAFETYFVVTMVYLVLSMGLRRLLVSGGVVGMLVLFFRIAKNKWARRLASGYIALFQGTPLLMQLFLMFFGLPMLGLRIEPWTAAALGLTFFASAYLAEIWRGGVDALPRGQWDAGASLGLHYLQELRLIILPQAFSITRAPTVGFLVQLIKSTALTSIIGFEELVRTSNAINNATFEPFTVYGLVALIFFVMCFPLTQYARSLERRATSN
ncbi:MAG: ABC transporter permease subunit, partial [Mesorhizobium sp.]